MKNQKISIQICFYCRQKAKIKSNGQVFWGVCQGCADDFHHVEKHMVTVKKFNKISMVKILTEEA